MPVIYEPPRGIRTSHWHSARLQPSRSADRDDGWRADYGSSFAYQDGSYAVIAAVPAKIVGLQLLH